jgi:hypothetical protein
LLDDPWFQESLERGEPAMLYPAAFAFVLCFSGFAAGQTPPPDAPAPSAPSQPAAPATPAPAVPAAPPAPGAPVEGGVSGIPDGGPAGQPTPLPELLARTPDVVRLSTLLGAQVLDQGSRSVALLHDFVARTDGRLVALVALPGGELVGVPLSGMVARAKPDLERGSDEVTIRSFKLARVSRRLDAAPEVEDVSNLGSAWLAELDAGTPDAAAADAPAAAPDSRDADAPAASPDSRDAPAAPSDARDTDAPAVPTDAAPLPLMGELLGRTALGPADEPIGTIVDVVVDVPNARIAYLMVLPRQGGKRPGEFRAVPFEALGPDGDAEGVPLTISARALASSPRIREQGRLPVDPFGPPAVGSTPEPR